MTDIRKVCQTTASPPPVFSLQVYPTQTELTVHKWSSVPFGNCEYVVVCIVHPLEPFRGIVGYIVGLLD